MSDGTATYTDLLELKDMAKHDVYKQFTIKLEEEIRMLQEDGTCI